MSTKPRKRTRFQWCERHRYLGLERRARQAEFAAEGGPSDGLPCQPESCRVHAGTDLFIPEVCTGEYLSQHASWART